MTIRIGPRTFNRDHGFIRSMLFIMPNMMHIDMDTFELIHLEYYFHHQIQRDEHEHRGHLYIVREIGHNVL